MQNNSSILAKAPVKLSIPDIHGIHPRRAALQQTIGESTRGTPHIKADSSLRVNGASLKCVNKLFPASAHKPSLMRDDVDRRIKWNQLRRLIGQSAIKPNFSGKDHPNRHISALGKTSRNQHSVEPIFHRAHLIYHG
ncbi:MAG: hypothetical protein LZF86_170010 [Nitrospira sp.]|nr:MAG: hypothetical protein LZF86_170010 [Nitrospira sp.]